MRRLLGLLALWIIGFLAQPALAQDSATLVADALRIEGRETLVADGHVEIFYRGQRLRASRVVFDRAADRLTIAGPITLTDGSGTVILASQAELKADMTEGILRSARVVMNEQMQMAAAEVFRVGGRYTAMTRVVASSCKVCKGAKAPLWELRARRVVHDQAERQIYFSNAQLRLGGVPVFYIPRLRMPDPTLTRATGFLMPTFRNSSTLGSGVRVPYFIALGKSRDVLIAPFVTSRGTKSVELRYRQAFRTGEISISAIGSRDDLLPGETRGYLLAEGRFALPRGYTLSLYSEAVTDDGYLLDYGLPAKDRLQSRIEVTRTRRDEFVQGRLIRFQSLRPGESDMTMPQFLLDGVWQKRLVPGALGGIATIELQGHAHRRRATTPFDTAIDPDSVADGRDMARLSLRAAWSRDWVSGPGLVFGLAAEARADVFAVAQDSAFAGGQTRTHGALAAELRWPWVKAGRGGVSHVIEPVAQIVLAPRPKPGILNEDSMLVEFDEGNLFALNRFAGGDAVEGGVRANLGINYLRQDPAGWTLGLSVGRVFRAEDPGQFTTSSGLDGRRSDWLAAWQLSSLSGLQLTNRFLLDDDMALTKGEMRLSIERDRFGLEAGYVFNRADAAEGRAIDTREIMFDGRVSLSDGWTARLSNRFDLEADRASRAGIGLGFRNECLSLDLSVSRRFTSSTSVKPTTDFAVSLELLGFGGSGKGGAARQCRG